MDAYARSNTLPADRDKRATPRWAFEAICAATGLDPVWDVCAETHTAVVPGRFYSAKHDALSIDWHLDIDPGLGLPVVWMNPPYSDPGAWCEKAALESARGMIVVGLLPDDRSTRWYQDHVYGIAPVIYITPRRLPFINPATGEEQSGNPKGSVVPIWTPFRTGRSDEVYFSREAWDAFDPRCARKNDAA